MREYNGNDFIKWLVTFNDFIILNVTMLAFMLVSPEHSPAFIHTDPKLFFFFGNSAMVVAQLFHSTIVHLRHLTFHEMLLRVCKLVLTQAVLAAVFIHFMKGNHNLFKFTAEFGAVLFVLIMLARIIERWFLRWYRQRGGNGRSVLLVGKDPALINVYRELTNDPSTGYTISGYYADTPIDNLPGDISLEYKGTIEDLNRSMDPSVEIRPYDEIFCSMSHNDSEEIVRLMRFCDDHVIHFHYVPRMFANYQLKLRAERVGSLDLFTNHVEPLSNMGNKFIKRLFDIVVSSLVCLLLLPFIPIIALCIKLQSPGPVFFRQKRTGLNGTSFWCYKFRSMHVNNQSDTAQATKDDPRKFPFGNFMRKTNLDEFPQFFNVLRGNMSIVGPRPHMLYHTELYSELIDKYMVRHFSKPGITGWAQVTGYRGETKDPRLMEERIKHDIWYIENWTFWLDMKIIFMTARSIIHPDKHAY